MRIEFEMPSVRRPYPSRAHPDISKLERHLNAWTRRYDLARTPASWARFTQARFHELVARGFPGVADPTWIGEWYNFLWFWDDQLDDGLPLREPSQLEQVIEDLVAMLPSELGTAPPPPNGLAAAIADLWRQMAPSRSRAWRLRFAACAQAYLSSYGKPLALQRHRPAPDLKTYLPFRRISGAMETVYPLLEAVEGFEIPEAIASLPEWRELLDSANDVTVWTNDLASARKELAHGETTNFVAVLQRQQSCGWQEAANLVAARISDRLDQYMALVQQVSSAVAARIEPDRDSSIGTRRYVGRITDWLAGSCDWHLGSARYRNIEHPVEGAVHAYLDPLLPLDRVAS